MTRAAKQHKEIKQVLNAIFKEYDIGSDSITDRNRFPRVVRVRFALWHILYHQYEWSQSEIARVFDREPSTVGRGISRAQRNIVRTITKAL